MKRRDFLTASASLSGLAVSRAFAAETKPCPPNTLGVTGGTALSTTCVNPTTAGAPSWFSAQSDGTWISIAAPGASVPGTGMRLADVKAGQNLGWGGTFESMTAAWTGGCVDAQAGELLLVANGGHADYVGNEAYACAIRSDDPGWYRLSDPSPSTAVKAVLPPDVVSGGTGLSESTGNTPTQQGGNPKTFAAMFGDGRMRAVHGWHSAIFHNGRAWYATQSSPTGIGYSTSHAWSWNRSHVNSNGATVPRGPREPPLPWENNPGPWKWLGYSGGREGMTFGTCPPCALDPVSGKIWMPNGTWLDKCMSLDTGTEAIRAGAFSARDHGGADGTWSAVVVDPSGRDLWRMLVVPSLYSRRLMVLDLKHANPYSAEAWSFPPVTNWAPLMPFEKASYTGFGAVYHRASSAILLGNPYVYRNGEVVVVRVPTGSDGNYLPGVAWDVSVITPRSGSENPALGVPAMDGSANQAHSKFNMIEDMGNGQSALVVVMGTTLPTYVYKLPKSGV